MVNSFSRTWFLKIWKGILFKPKKDLWMCFPEGEDLYLFPHDEVLELILSSGRTMTGSKSWEVDGAYSFTGLSSWMKPVLAQYKLSSNSETNV